MAKNNKPRFYHKFVNEDNLKAIGDASIQKKFALYSIYVEFCSACAGTQPSFFGFNPKSDFSVLLSISPLIFFILTFYYTIKFILLDKKYKVFKKRYYAFLFTSIYCLLSIIFAIVGCLVTKVTTNEHITYLADVNLFPVICIYLPLYISYMIFCTYAYDKCFVKYIRNVKRKGQDQDKDN